MAETNSVARSLHDVGLAAWFGGSLMGAVGLNGAAAQAKDPTERNAIASAGWARWTPVNLAAIGAHLVGGALLVANNKARLGSQKGVATSSLVKTGLTAAALGVTGYARLQGQKQIDNPSVATRGATEPSSSTPSDVATAQNQQRFLQWSIPALTGAVLVMNAWMGEQQRPAQVASGVLGRLLPGD